MDINKYHYSYHLRTECSPTTLSALTIGARVYARKEPRQGVDATIFVIPVALLCEPSDRALFHFAVACILDDDVREDCDGVGVENRCRIISQRVAIKFNIKYNDSGEWLCVCEPIVDDGSSPGGDLLRTSFRGWAYASGANGTTLLRGAPPIWFEASDMRVLVAPVSSLFGGALATIVDRACY